MPSIVVIANVVAGVVPAGNNARFNPYRLHVRVPYRAVKFVARFTVELQRNTNVVVATKTNVFWNWVINGTITNGPNGFTRYDVSGIFVLYPANSGTIVQGVVHTNSVELTTQWANNGTRIVDRFLVGQRNVGILFGV